MQTTSAPMAWLFLPENEQVQYLQKIALRAEKHLAPNSSFCATYFSGIELRIAPEGRKDHRRGYNPQ